MSIASSTPENEERNYFTSLIIEGPPNARGGLPKALNKAMIPKNLTDDNHPASEGENCW
jgi:hypothetical protein